MEQKYAFRPRMCEVHRPLEGAPQACPCGYLDLSLGCAILLSRDADAVARHAAHDLADFFRVSCGVTAEVTDTPSTHPAIRLCLAADSPDTAPTGGAARAYRITVTDGGVTVTANTGRGLFAATVYLEERMSEVKGPYLALGEIDRRPLFTPRMVHSGYALDEFPEDYMNRLAHDGYDTLLVFVKGPNLTPRGECDFNALIASAARYGLDVYAYSYMVSEKHPDDEGAEEFYESTYGELFRQNPGFRGVVFVGESCEFPSHDERAHPWLNRYNKNPDGTLRSNKVNARTFPVRDYPEWIALVKRIIRKYQPEADFLFWTYNWGYRPADVRVELIENLPTDISLQATFEMFEPLPTPEGVSETTTDYTVCTPGPGRYFLSEAEAAKRRGLRLYTISNTAGTTWDVGIVPFIPAPEVWGERYERLLECHEKYGLCGLMEGHHYGAYHSFISELSKEMGCRPAAISASTFARSPPVSSVPRMPMPSSLPGITPPRASATISPRSRISTAPCVSAPPIPLPRKPTGSCPRRRARTSAATASPIPGTASTAASPRPRSSATSSASSTASPNSGSCGASTTRPPL